MNILIAHNFSDFSYAAASKALAIKLVKEGNKVIFFSHADPDNFHQSEGFELHRWPQKRPTGFASFWAVYRIIRKHNIQTLIAHAAALNMVGLAAKIAGVPIRIGYYHSAYEATLIDNNNSAFLTLIKRLRKQLFYKCFNKMVCVSKFAQSNLHSWFHYALANTVVIPNALVDRFSGGQIHQKPALQPMVFFAPGRLDPGKNTLAMARGFIAFSNRHPGKASLLIAGGGPLAEDISALANAHECIKYLGQVPYASIDSFISNSHVVVCSTLAEAFGMTIIEAMMLATPVLASAVGGPAEIVQEGQTGWLVEGSTPDVWKQAFESTYQFIHRQPASFEEMRRLARQNFLTHYQQNQQLVALEQLLQTAAG